MDKKHLESAFDHLSDKHIREAASYRRPRVLPYMSAIAAVLVCAILIGVFAPRQPGAPTSPTTINGDTDRYQPPEPFQGTLTPVSIPTGSSSALLCAPSYPLMAPYSTESYEVWRDSLQQIHQTEPGYAASLDSYFRQISAAVLKDQTGNAVFSPLNIYMALAMLAETTQGESRQQILSLLAADDITQVRKQAEQVWRAHYNNDGLATSILGSSLWLDKSYRYNEDTVSTLADYYYASVFRGDLGTEAMNDALRQWLNANTGNLLADQVANISLSPGTAIALISTIYYQVEWQSAFNEKNNSTEIFHSPTGDTQATFMHASQGQGPYYWGEDFGAVSLPLRDGSRMWLILPDEGKTPQDLLASGYAMDMVLSKDYTQQKTMIVNISVPKFDISSDLGLKDTLQALGIKDVFDQKKADLSAILPESENTYVRKIQHAARFIMHEDGISAAAYTLLLYAGAAEPPEEEMDFTLDRPFLFVVESSSGLPIFTGIVTQP